MNTKAHWNKVYATRAAEAVSWYSPHLETSRAFIEHTNAGHAASILDAGGGQSTLGGYLLAQGYQKITILDISATAVEAARRRMGKNADSIQWIVDDVTLARLPEKAYDIWHDRAVFHFLVSPEQRAAYIRQAIHALKPRSHLILATFALEGSTRCNSYPGAGKGFSAARKHGNPAPDTLRPGTAIHVLPLSDLLRKAAQATE